MNSYSIHFSNRAERLYESLKSRLFADTHPFTKRMIVVPSAAMKSWLLLKMAEDKSVGIAAGMEIAFVDASLHKLYQILSSEHDYKKYYSPSELEIAFALEEAIKNVVGTYQLFSASLHQDWHPLIDYLGVSRGKKMIVSTARRIRALSSQLASIFRDYGIYGKELLAEWKDRQYFPGRGSLGWQKLLWDHLEDIFGCWDYPVRKFSSFSYENLEPMDIHVHLFGLSFLPPVHHDFLRKISEHIPVCAYLLSPCQKFWGDILSDKERMRLVNYWNRKGAPPLKMESLDEFLRDCNPMLANFGRLGRETAVAMESMDALCHGNYALPESILKEDVYQELIADGLALEKSQPSLTMLEALQADIVLLRNPEHAESTKHLVFSHADTSIQIHAAPKIRREVEAIYDALVSIVKKHQHDKDPILPRDICVMAPDISIYAPFIRSVFESSESQLEIQVMDIAASTQHILIQGFLHLLSLSNGRWEASALLQLFEYPSFLSRHDFSYDDVAVIREWVKEAGIYWGRDQNHRGEIFKKEYQVDKEKAESVIGTWEHGFGRLLEGLAMSVPEHAEAYGNYHPINALEMSQGTLFGKLLSLIRSLQADLTPLMDGTLMSLQDWSVYYQCLVDAYFAPLEDDKGYEILKEHIERFAKSSTRLKEAKYPFDTIYFHFKRLLEQTNGTYKETNLQSVRFSSLLPMRAIPAKVIVLMGMGDGLFPRREKLNTLHLLKENAADYFPSQEDFDRYLFLESLLSARTYFLLSYVSQAPGETQELSSSLPIKEMTGYLDQTYRIYDGKSLVKPSIWCSYHHSLIPFHHSYFSTDGRLKSYSEHYYKAASACYHSEKQNAHSFLSSYLPRPEVSEASQLEMIVDLKDLLAFAKNPLKTYLNQALGIYVEKESNRIIRNEEDLLLSDLNAAILSKQGVLSSKAAAIMQGEKSAQLPQGLFKKAAIQKVERDIDSLTANLKACGIDVRELFSIDLSPHSTHSTYADGVWKVPSLTFEIPKIGKVNIVGKIEHLSEKGKVLFVQDEIKKMIGIWPECLTLRYVAEREGLKIVPQLVFAKGKKAKMRQIHIEDATTSFVDYLIYYFHYKSNPSPLVPDWMPSLMSGKDKFEQLLQDISQNPFHKQFDQYIMWLQRNSKDMVLEPDIGYWQNKVYHIFPGVFNNLQH